MQVGHLKLKSGPPLSGISKRTETSMRSCLSGQREIKLRAQQARVPIAGWCGAAGVVWSSRGLSGVEQ